MDSSEPKGIQALNTLVFETLGEPESEREFKFKALKKWGLDLLLGRKDGKEAFFVAEYGKREVGEVYREDGIEYEVGKVLYEMPKNKKLFAHVEMKEGKAYLVGELREENQNIEILRLPAASLLLAYFKKHRFFHLARVLRNVGTVAELFKQRGQEGKPYPFEKLPNTARRFLREAKKIEKKAGFGRVALAYFGENKDGNARFRVSWLLPTIALFESSIAEKADKVLTAFK
jgi:uncharacterized protein (TIGR00703 family)